METTSCAIIPVTETPDPKESVVLAYAEVIDEDLEGSNNGVVELQEAHNVSKTKRSADPVARMRLNNCGLLNGITFVND